MSEKKKTTWIDKFNELKKEEPRMAEEIKTLEENETAKIETLKQELENTKNIEAKGSTKEEVLEAEEAKKQKVAELEKKLASLQKGYNFEIKEDGKVSRSKTEYNKKKIAYAKFQKNKPQLENLYKLQLEEEAKLEKAKEDIKQLEEARKTLEQRKVDLVKITSQRDRLIEEINQKGLSEEKRNELYALMEETQTNMRNVESEKTTLSTQIKSIEYSKPEARRNNAENRLENIRIVATGLLRGINMDKIGIATKQPTEKLTDSKGNLSLGKKLDEERDTSEKEPKEEKIKAEESEKTSIAVSKPPRFQKIRNFFSKIKKFFTRKDKSDYKELEELMEEAKKDKTVDTEKQAKTSEKIKDEEDLLYVKEVAKYGKEEALVRRLQRETARANKENAKRFGTQGYKDQVNIAQKYEDTRRKEFLESLQRNEGIDNLQKRFEQKRAVARAAEIAKSKSGAGKGSR